MLSNKQNNLYFNPLGFYLRLTEQGKLALESALRAKQIHACKSTLFLEFSIFRITFSFSFLKAFFGGFPMCLVTRKIKVVKMCNTVSPFRELIAEETTTPK